MGSGWQLGVTRSNSSRREYVEDHDSFYSASDNEGGDNDNRLSSPTHSNLKTALFRPKIVQLA